MQTSTPLLQGNARRRVSLAPVLATPQVCLDETNDDIERAERRKSVALRKSIAFQNVMRGNEGGHNDSVLNDSIKRLTEEDLKSQLQTICQLHAENKINTRNAWNLRVIDILKQVVSRDNVDVLRVAGSSLEIAGKVYGLRVDDMHAESLKLASNLARNFKQGENDDDPENPDANAEDNQAEKPKKKKVKKRRLLQSGDKKLTVNEDPKAFTGNLPMMESATFSVKTDAQVSSIGNLFTNTVRMDPTGYKFSFASQVKYWAWSPENDELVKKDLEKKYQITVSPAIKTAALCQAFKDFRMDNWDPEEENRELANAMMEEVVVDDQGFPIAELDGSIHDVFEDRDNDFNDDDADNRSIEENVNAPLPLVREDLERITDFIPDETRFTDLNQKSDYSYNTLVTTCAGKMEHLWAGPHFWKLKCIRPDKAVYSGIDKENQNKVARVKKPKKQFAPVDLTTLPPVADYIEANEKPKKKKNKLMDEDKITLPPLDDEMQEFIAKIDYLMMVPNKRLKKPSLKEAHENGQDLVTGDESNFNNGADLGDDNGADNDGFGDGNDDAADDMPPSQFEGFDGDNLVNAPEMIEQVGIDFAKRAKKMDMKKLKEGVWRTLTNLDVLDYGAAFPRTSFEDMYRQLPKHLHNEFVKELTAPTTFVALLHLCNEQTLQVLREDPTDLTDFLVQRLKV